MTNRVFAAIDFETADYGCDSACAVGLALVCEGRIVDRFTALIRPPRSRIVFAGYHGLTWSLLEDQPCFDAVWPRLLAFLEPAEFLVAHNAPFDRKVLHGCCDAFGCSRPRHSFQCTCRLARRVWPRSGSYRLPDICHRLGIRLEQHHNAAADAEACARLMLAILERAPGILDGKANTHQR